MNVSSLIKDQFMSLPRQGYIVLSGRRSPGVAHVRGAGSPRKWDTPGGYGIDGSSTVYTGAGLARFDVDIRLWEPEHFIEWNLFARILDKPKARQAGGLGIRHPLVNGPPLYITSVVVEDVSQFEDNGFGLFVCTIKLLEFRQGKQTGAARLQGTIPPAGINGVSPPTARDKGEERILQLTNQVQLLGGWG